MQKLLTTAHELFYKMLKENDECTSVDMMIEFAKLHAQAALESAAENAKAYTTISTYEGRQTKVRKQSILNAYPLENIK